MSLSRELELFKAIKAGKIEIAKQLLNQGVSFQVRFNKNHQQDDVSGVDAFYAVVEHGHISFIKKCLSIGVDLNKGYKKGKILLLSRAVYLRQTEVVRLLIEHGADPTQKDGYDLYPIDYAYQQDIIDLLKAGGAVERAFYYQGKFIRNANELIRELKNTISPSNLPSSLNNKGKCYGLSIKFIDFSRLENKEEFYFYIRFVNSLTDFSVKELAKQYANNDQLTITDGLIKVPFSSLIKFIKEVYSIQENQQEELIKHGISYDACHVVACNRSEIEKNVSFHSLKQGNSSDEQYKLVRYSYENEHHVMVLYLENNSGVFYNSNAFQGEQNCHNENQFAKIINETIPKQESAPDHIAFFIFDISFNDENKELDDLLKKYDDIIKNHDNLLSFINFYKRKNISKRDAAFHLIQIIEAMLAIKPELKKFKDQLKDYLIKHPIHFAVPNDLKNLNSAVNQFYSVSLMKRSCYFGSIEIVQNLLKNGADLKVVSINSVYDWGHVEIFKFLLWSAQTKLGPREDSKDRLIANRQREIELLIKQKQIVDQLVIDSDMSEETKPAVKIRKLFYSYAYPPFFSTHWRNNRKLAREISEELAAHSDWSIDECLSYIHAQIKDQQIENTGTFAGIFLVIDQMKKATLSQSFTQHQQSPNLQ